MSSLRLIVFGLVVSVAAVGCAKVQARTEPPLPELTPPPPPPRLVETYAEEAPPVVAEAPPAETSANTPATRNTAKPPVTPTPKPEGPKPEPPRTEPEKPATPPAALTLKPAPGTESTTEGSIRLLIGNASRDLARVNYASLNQDGKAQYDTAKRFMQQADEALKNGNLPFAGKLADKAATMAAVLVR